MDKNFIGRIILFAVLVFMVSLLFFFVFKNNVDMGDSYCESMGLVYETSKDCDMFESCDRKIICNDSLYLVHKYSSCVEFNKWDECVVKDYYYN